MDPTPAFESDGDTTVIAIAALLPAIFQLQSFADDTPLPQYLIGAVWMGFGGTLAAGCAGVTGGSLIALPAWVALVSMWIGAGTADHIVDASRHAAFNTFPPTGATRPAILAVSMPVTSQNP